MALMKREKVLIFLAILAAAIWAFDQFCYTPQARKIASLKAQIRAADLRLQESLLYAQGVETVEAEVLRLEKELQRLSDKMLRGEEFRAFLRHLGRESDRLQMKMVSLTTEEERPPPPEGDKTVAPIPHRRVAIQIVLHSPFSSLRTYLEGLGELPFLVALDHLQIERIGERTSLLKVTMGLSVFVVL